MKLLYYSPASYGGLADYAHEQANALVDIGVEVVFLCTPNYSIGRQAKYNIVSILEEAESQKQHHKIFKLINFFKTTLINFGRLADFIKKNHIKYVLLGSYVEYFSPFWSMALRHLAKQKVVFGAIAHDPVRDFVLGPMWWHRWSIACGYSFLREVFVHENIALDTVKKMPQLRTTVIPHGIYTFPQATKTVAEMREILDIPPDKTILLSFGHIRDGKNLDLVIKAMINFPDLYLVVAGKEQSSQQKPSDFYQELAKKMNVSERCRWLINFIAQEEAANLFTVCNFVLMTYSQDFRSASGVLNVAANYRKPCIASGGEGSLKSVVQQYDIGTWIEPDDLNALIIGIRRALDQLLEPKWGQYFLDNSWQKNAQLVIESFCN